MHIFISYSRQFPYLAESLKQLFEENGYKVWLDVEDILGGSQWELQIYQEIQRAFVVVVVVTTPSLNSEWIKKEIDFAMEQNKIIIPLIMERMTDTTKALSSLGLENVQAIDFVSQRKTLAERELYEAVKAVFEQWAALKPYLDQINDPNREVRGFAIRKLGELGQRAKSSVPRLLSMLKHEDWHIRYEISYALLEIGDPVAGDSLIEMLETALNEYQVDAHRNNMDIDTMRKNLSIESTIEIIVMALGILRIERSTDILIKTLQNYEKFKYDVLLAMGMLSAPKTVEMISKVLKEDLSTVKNYRDHFAAVMALGFIGIEDTALPIIEWFNKNMIDEDEGIVDSEFYISDDNLYWYWSKLNFPHYLVDRLADDGVSVHCAAAIVLGLLRNKSAFDVLVKLIRVTYDDDLAHLGAILALGNLGDKRAIEILNPMIGLNNQAQPYIQAALEMLHTNQ